MKVTQIIYIFFFIGIVVYIIKSTHLLEGFEDTVHAQAQAALLGASDPRIPKGLKAENLDVRGKPNPTSPGSLPFAPYSQTASVGSYQYQDPAQMAAHPKQMKQLFEDVRAFLVFEGVSIANSSDPTVSLPLTQLRADNERLQQELSVTENNPGVESSLTQQNLADIQGSLTFLQRKVRLFQTAGVISDSKGTEGFMGAPPPTNRLRATKAELQLLQTKVTAAILILSASGTTDPIVQSRIKNLQAMYTSVSDMINKLQKGIWTQQDVPVFSEDIKAILPNLADPKKPIPDISKGGQGSQQNLSPIEKQLAGLVGDDNARDVYNKLKEKGMFRVTLDMGYNIPSYGSKSSSVHIKKEAGIKKDGTLGFLEGKNMKASPSISVDGPYDTTMSGSDDRALSLAAADAAADGSKNPSHLDWKGRAKGICEQVKRRGMDPLDFGCIPEGSKLSPAYSWRGHTKMVCGRLASTMDPGLPETCGCPPPNWKGWTLPSCLSSPPPMGGPSSRKGNCPV